jgi:hypothetical protein
MTTTTRRSNSVEVIAADPQPPSPASMPTAMSPNSNGGPRAEAMTASKPARLRGG